MASKKEVRNRGEADAKNFAVQTRNSEVAMRIKDAVVAAGGATAIKLRSGLAIGTINNAQSGTNLPGTETLIKLAAATGRSIDWLLTGGEQEVSAEADFVAVPLLPEAASMGDGRDAEANDSIVDRLVMFRREWVSRLGINPLRAHVLPVVGDSMEPTLLGGDVVLCDTGDQSLGGGGVFVVNTEDGPVVKRLERDDEGVVLVVSDNKRHRVRRVVPPFSDTFRIIGRVRWYARTLR